MVPAVVCRIVDAIRPAPIAHGHVGTTDEELTNLASKRLPAFLVHETNLSAWRNPTYRPRP